jgi:enhancing lycopene biosynthesis protein 2
MSKRVGVILSGCGFKDGAEIHESVCTLLALDQAGAQVRCFAPNVEFEVVDHLTGKPTGERRNALHEAARIARGKIEDVAKARAEELDALVMPGGYGAAKVLSDFATRGPGCDVIPAVARLIDAMHRAGKPIGAICIAPAVVAKVLGKSGVTLTIGHDAAGTGAALEAMGAKHKVCDTNQSVLDTTNKVASTPAYMHTDGIALVWEGVRKAVADVLRMA